MSSTADAVGGPARSAARFLVAVGAPLALIALSYLLWLISDRLRHIGPLDRAAFGWGVVIPIWVAAPVAAGFAWRSMTPRERRLEAIVVGTVVAGVATVLIWQSIAFPDCGTGVIHTPAGLVAPSVLVGIVVGGGVAVSGLLAATQVRHGRPGLAVAVGAASELVMILVAIVVAAATVLGPACQRPST